MFLLISSIEIIHSLLKTAFSLALIEIVVKENTSEDKRMYLNRELQNPPEQSENHTVNSFFAKCQPIVSDLVVYSSQHQSFPVLVVILFPLRFSTLCHQAFDFVSWDILLISVDVSEHISPVMFGILYATLWTELDLGIVSWSVAIMPYLL